jgi:hypothetical protein
MAPEPEDDFADEQIPTTNGWHSGNEELEPGESLESPPLPEPPSPAPSNDDADDAGADDASTQLGEVSAAEDDPATPAPGDESDWDYTPMSTPSFGTGGELDGESDNQFDTPSPEPTTNGDPSSVNGLNGASPAAGTDDEDDHV